AVADGRGYSKDAEGDWSALSVPSALTEKLNVFQPDWLGESFAALSPQGYYRSNSGGEWVNRTRGLPVLLPGGAYSREFKLAAVRANDTAIATGTEVLWFRDDLASALPVEAKGVGLGVSGELFIAGPSELLVSREGQPWAAYPVELGGYRGVAHQL